MTYIDVVARAALLLLVWCAPALADTAIPAAPLMTVYQFDGPAAVPYYDLDRFLRGGPTAPAGSLAQGSSVIPCLVVRGGEAVTDEEGTPYVGFEVVVDAAAASPDANARFTEVFRQRKAMTVANHHCPPGVEYVLDVRKLHALGKPPRFEPPRSAAAAATDPGDRGQLDEIVRAFHASRQCDEANRQLMGRRASLGRAWDAFIAANVRSWPASSLERARNLDYVMRTAIYEGHLDRGCSAYGACERNLIALSIRNRGRERCLRGQGCRSAGDFEGVASTVSQYNIWDEYLTQTSGLTACFLRPDLAGDEHASRLQAMYAQSVGDVETILYGSERQLEAVFPGSSASELTGLRHYYHPPAMGKCFPNHTRLEFITAAVARRGDDFALIANTRIRVDDPEPGGYRFRQVAIDEEADRDVVRFVDRYPDFVIDGRKVALARPARCAPYGVPRGCRFDSIGRHRRTPGWLASGTPLQVSCRVRARGEDCRAAPTLETARVGGVCDIKMQPIAGVR